MIKSARLYDPLVRVLLSVACVTAPFASLAADPPDAGRLLREQPTQSPQIFQPPGVTIEREEAEEPAAPMGPTLVLSDFAFEGVNLVSEVELRAHLSSFLNKKLSFDDLQQIPVAVTSFYSSKGLVARAVLPPQDIDQGILRIRVIEGSVGEVRVNNRGERVRTEGIEGFIGGRLAPGEPMDLSRLGEALNIINDQPGVKASSSLAAGAAEGEVDVFVTSEDKPLTVFNGSLTNHGSRATGEARAVASATLQNPTGRFDSASLLLTETQGSSFVTGNYGLAVGYTGLRMGVNASYLDYDVVQDSLKASEASGRAITYGVFGSYPLYRLKMFSLGLTGSVGQKELKDFTVAGEVGDRQVAAGTFGLNGKRQDAIGGGGVTSFGVSLTYGNSDQRNEGAKLQDEASRDAFNDFSKVMYSLRRQQQLAPLWVLDTSLRGQYAFDNLDSSERFSLGGVSGVRAYPTGEAGGDEGHILSVNLVKQFTGTVYGTVFYDLGYVRDNYDTWNGWNAGDPGQDNSYHISGAGVAVDWSIHESISFSASVATPIGSNPGRDANGNDSDGRDQDLRGWVGLIAQF
jgi:hemolysin activation/secretion protein